jgi:hypothetical protein
MSAATASGAAAEGGVPERKQAGDRSSAVVLRSRASASPFRLPTRTATSTSNGSSLSKPAGKPELDGTGILDPVALTLDERQAPREMLEVVAPQFQLPSSYQPSRAAPFQQHFVSYLISSLRSPLLYQAHRQSWAFELPTLLTSGGPTTVYSIRAAAMAFYGNLAGDESIQTDACRWYAMGLTSQRSLLQTGRPKRMPTMEEIFAPIMFSMFEVVVCTDPNGWIHHLSAAGRMLEMRGPENCRDGIVHMLFRTVRLSSVRLPSIF